MLGARLRNPRTRVQGFVEPSGPTDEDTGRSVVGGAFLCITALACGGAWTMAHGALPKLRYDIDESDFTNWKLAYALEEMKTPKPTRCTHLAAAIEPVWDATDRREWPRKMRVSISPELSAWREAADRCMEQLVADFERGKPSLTVSSLLESPLLQSEDLHARALALTQKTPDAAPASGGNREALLEAIRGPQKLMRDCYERELRKKPDLGGKLVVDLVIGPTGKVLSAEESAESHFPSEKVTSCVLQQFRAIQVTQFKGGEELKVVFPLVFKPAE